MFKYSCDREGGSEILGGSIEPPEPPLYPPQWAMIGKLGALSADAFSYASAIRLPFYRFAFWLPITPLEPGLSINGTAVPL